MHTLNATIDRFEGGKAVVRFDDSQELILAKRQLPDSIKEGSLLTFEIYRQEAHEIRRQSIAHYLLKEVLESHEPKNQA